MDSLDQISKNYFLDKNGYHNYVVGYASLFDNIRSDVKSVLEIGIGSVENNQMHHVSVQGYRTGNSLRCWRDYFPNANVYGIDIYDVKGQIQGEDRITTFVADQGNEANLLDVVKNIGAIDVVVDDGSHILYHQVFSFMVLEKFLSDKGIYVIEDIQANNIQHFLDLTCFADDYRKYVLDKYEIKYFDTRNTHKSDDFMIAFIKK
uniref:Methyltransferase n=1 Tax=viral metagenome TaxID=1070528 RepID=A0A6C0C5K7_9ZZZZ